jgi:hypothetical protein
MAVIHIAVSAPKFPVGRYKDLILKLYCGEASFAAKIVELARSRPGQILCRGVLGNVPVIFEQEKDEHGLGIVALEPDSEDGKAAKDLCLIAGYDVPAIIPWP